MAAGLIEIIMQEGVAILVGIVLSSGFGQQAVRLRQHEVGGIRATGGEYRTAGVGPGHGTGQ